MVKSRKLFRKGKKEQMQNLFQKDILISWRTFELLWRTFELPMQNPAGIGFGTGVYVKKVAHYLHYN
jgi:hypothetical protein